MHTVYDHIAENNRKTLLLLLLFPLCLSIVVLIALIGAFRVIGDEEFLMIFIRPYYDLLFNHNIIIVPENMYWIAAIICTLTAMPIVFALCFGWMTISYLFGDKLMLWATNAKPLERKDNPQIYNLVENVSIAAGLPCPKIYIIKDSSLNAFATGRNPNNATVTLTVGIIEKLEPLELEGVIAHEMAHIGNRDIRLNMLIITGLSVFGFFATIMRENIRENMSVICKNSKHASKFAIVYFALLIAFSIFNCFVAPAIRLAISRTREYAADATAALITRNPEALASALAKISNDSKIEKLYRKKSVATACIANPHKKSALTSLLSTHPPIKKRIKRLREMVGPL